MPYEKDSGFTDELPEAEPAEEQAPKPRSRLRWLGIGIAAAVMLLGIVSLITALSHRTGEDTKPVDLSALRSTIASEEEQLCSSA